MYSIRVMTKSKWTDIVAMLNDMADHSRKWGGPFLASDNIGIYGFIAEGERPKSWEITPANLRKSLTQDPDRLRRSLVREAFSTASGRMNLVASLPPKEVGARELDRFSREDPL